MTEHASVMKMATIRGEVLLSSEFGLYPKKRNVYKVSLSRTGIFYSLLTDKEGASEVKVVHLSDVIGCRCQSSLGCASAFITIFSYPFKQKVFSSKSTRKRVPVIFEVKQFSSFDDNLKLAEKWRNVINCLSRSIPLNGEGKSTNVNSRVYISHIMIDNDNITIRHLSCIYRSHS